MSVCVIKFIFAREQNIQLSLSPEINKRQLKVIRQVNNTTEYNYE